MYLFICRVIRYVAWKLKYYLHPKEIIWRYLRVNRPNKAIIVKLLNKGLSVRIYPRDVIGESIYVNGCFEPGECKFVNNYLKSGMCFFDIGANLGQYTLLAAKAVGSSGSVHSFEPSSRIFAELKYNIELNELSSRCHVNNVAVSDKDGVVQLSKYEPGAEVFGSIGKGAWPGRSIIGYEDVQAITLDSYIEENSINIVNLIKIDIEGAELLALRGSEQLLQKRAPVLILEMADVNTKKLDYNAIEIWEYLEKIDYVFYCFDRKGIITGKAKRPNDFAKAQNLVASKEIL